MLCMTFFFCAPLQSAGGFILEGDWTPTKMNLFYSPPIEVGVLSPFKIKSLFVPEHLINSISSIYKHLPSEKTELSHVISFLQFFICPYLIIMSFLDRFISEISYFSLPSIAISYLFGQRNMKKLSILSVHGIDLYCFGQINRKKSCFSLSKS